MEIRLASDTHRWAVQPTGSRLSKRWLSFRLEGQPGGSGSLSQLSYPTMILVTTAIKFDLSDPGSLSPLGNRLSDHLCGIAIPGLGNLTT
jgi:hypothetical protein